MSRAPAPGSPTGRCGPAGPHRPRAAGIVLATLAGMLLATLGAPDATGQPAGLFRPVATSALAAGSGFLPASPAADAATLRQRLVSIDLGQLSPAAAGADSVAPQLGTPGPLQLNLFDDASFTGVIERVAPTFSGGYALSGRLAGVELGTVTLVVNGETVAGSVWTPDGSYRIRPAAGGLHAISQIDPSRLPPPGEPIELGPERDGPPSGARRDNAPPVR